MRHRLRALLEKRPIVVQRRRHFFSDDMPERVTLTFAIPPELGDTDAILARIRTRVAEVEAPKRRSEPRPAPASSAAAPSAGSAGATAPAPASPASASVR